MSEANSENLPTPESYFPNYSDATVAEQSRLAELASVATLLSKTTVENMQLNVRVPLSHFNFFAPYFLNVKPVGDSVVKDGDQLRNMWHGCCRSLQHDVDVFHDSNQTVLFTVPAYLDTDILNVNPANLAGESFDRMRRKMEAERNFPEDAVNTYQIGTNRRVDSLIAAGSSEERHARKVKMWAVIYNFYGVDVTQLPGYQPNANPTSVSAAQGFNSPSPFGTFGGFNNSL